MRPRQRSLILVLVRPSRRAMFRTTLRSAALILAYGLTGCSIMCDDQITGGGTSPDGEYVATVWQRNCGTPGAATHVSIRASRDRFTARADDSVFTVDNSPPVGAYWTADSSLRIECIRCTSNRVTKRADRWHNVTISYQSYGTPQEGG